MKRKYTFLVLTDHAVHRASNPVYSLLPELFVHKQCQSIHIASRSNPANRAFFSEEEDALLSVTSVTAKFKFDPSGKQFLDVVAQTALSEYDVVLMRLPHPVSDSFLSYLRRVGKATIFINNPEGIKETSNKAFLLHFKKLCPPMRLCKTIDDIIDFAAQFPIVLKPLRGYGGAGIVKIEEEIATEGKSAEPFHVFLERKKEYVEQEHYLAMPFLKNVHMGDKRILVLDGEILGASLRLPAENSWLCNVAQGGKSVAATVEEEEEEIIRSLKPMLKAKGILIAGIDTLVNDRGKRILSEINTLSVGGFQSLEKQDNRPIISITIQKIIEYVEQKLKFGPRSSNGSPI